jgi:hypothetical protein
MRPLCTSVLALLVALAAWAPCFAQEPAPAVPAVHEELAKSLFAEGVSLSEDGRWGDAAERFARSMQLFPRSRTALNLAVALVRSGRPAQALETLERYRELAVDVSAEELERAHKLREQAESMVAHLSLEIYPVETELEVDDRALPHVAKQWLVLDPGRHVVEARHGGERRTLTLDLQAGERVTHEIRWPAPEPSTPLPLVSPSAAAPAAEPPHAPPRAERPPRRWKPWVIAGSAVVAVAAAAAITTWALRRGDASGGSCPDNEVCIGWD